MRLAKNRMLVHAPAEVLSAMKISIAAGSLASAHIFAAIENGIASAWRSDELCEQDSDP